MTASSESNPPGKLIVVVRRAHGLRDDLVGLPKASVMLQCNGQQHRTLVAVDHEAVRHEAARIAALGV